MNTPPLVLAAAVLAGCGAPPSPEIGDSKPETTTSANSSSSVGGMTASPSTSSNASAGAGGMGGDMAASAQSDASSSATSGVGSGGAGGAACVPSSAACNAQCGGTASDECGSFVFCSPALDGCCHSAPEEGSVCKGTATPAAISCDGSTGYVPPPACHLVNGSAKAQAYYCCEASPPTDVGCLPSAPAAACGPQCGGAGFDGCGGIVMCPTSLPTCCKPDAFHAAECAPKPATPAALDCFLSTGFAIPASCVPLTGIGPSGDASYCCPL